MAWFLCVCLFSAVGLAFLLLQAKLRRSHLGNRAPPCLPWLPLIGSLLSLRSSRQPHVLFQDLQQKYGHTYSLMMGSHTVIIVNHYRHAKEVLLRKGKTFAGRPRTVSIVLMNSCNSISLYCIFNLFFSLPTCNSCVSKVTTDILTRDGKDIAFADYSATWRFHRKIVHGALCMFGEGSASIEKISEYQTIASSSDTSPPFPCHDKI